ncbi:helix-turn-helix transcriptional regulator [Sphingomonas aurantiaca]|uniref:helix-turn-helix domain-containing protein n=1 Tax=Sphingomonas aurantiaca TaxID=185949 RepID=UPI002FE357FB
MTIGERIEERRKAIGIKSQSELARIADMRQSTLNGLIRNPYRWSPYLTKIARALQTTVEYLTGETNDPDMNAPPPPLPTSAMVMMPVSLPTERALKVMFKALLAGIDRELGEDEQAELLAQRLPIGLAQLQYARFDLPTPVAETVGEDLATSDREPLR